MKMSKKLCVKFYIFAQLSHYEEDIFLFKRIEYHPYLGSEAMHRTVVAPPKE